MSTHRYTLTRLCLLEGSMALQKTLLALFGTLEGEIILRDERGEEFSARISHREHKMMGLRDFFTRAGLQVNDVITLTRLEERKFQVEAVVRHPRVASSRAAALPIPSTAPRRTVLGENAFMREVRVERRPSLSFAEALPSREQAAREQAAREPHPREAAVAAETSTPAPEPLASLTPLVRERRLESVRQDPSVEVAGRRYVPILPQSVPTAPPAGGAPRPATPAPAARPAPRRSIAHLELLERFAQTLGYTLSVGPELLRLEARLGRQSYSVALVSALEGSPDWPTLEAASAEFRAVLVQEDTALEHPPAGVTRVSVQALEHLLESALLSPLTPLELRGYWSTAAIDLVSAASLADLCARELGSRGSFSQVLLCLAEYEPHSSVRLHNLAHRLGERINRAELETTLETLTRPPFLALSRVGEHEYYLRQSPLETLTLLGDYAVGLGARMRRVGAVAQRSAAPELLEV